jgi:flavin reductase (DIM6/NTAB) family NADH-FMN oxidoreductase RutF
VAESRLKYALALRSSQTIDFNGVVLLIGEITHLHVEREAIAECGYIDIESLGSIAVSGLDNYHVTDSLGRLTYAKSHTKPEIFG